MIELGKSEPRTYEVDRAADRFRAVCVDVLGCALFAEGNVNHLLALPRWVREQVVVRRDPHAGLGGGEDGLSESVSEKREAWKR